MAKGLEVQKAERYPYRVELQNKYLHGPGLDIGPVGIGTTANETITPYAIGVDLDYPGYDGTHLPFEDSSQQFVFASHIMEHIPQADLDAAFLDWFRVLRVGGVLFIELPHQHLAEKKKTLPSQFYHPHHHTFWTPGTFVSFVERLLEPNSYRIRHLKDCDEEYDYSVGPNDPQNYYIDRIAFECIIEKLPKPKWGLNE